MMREKFWRELKARLCPRENWHLDEDYPYCGCCRKAFTCIRRKHHCRFCGKIFCSDCSNIYINGTYLGLSEKYVRHCEFCRESFQKIKEDLNRLTYIVDEEDNLIKQREDTDPQQSSDQENYFFSIKHIFNSVEKDEMQKIIGDLELEAKSTCKKLYRKFIETGGIGHQFEGNRLLQTLVKSLSDCKMNILPEELDSIESYMDANQHIEIKILTGEPGELMEVVGGMVLEKSIAIKGMESSFIEPQIIIIENSLDEGAVKVKFEELIKSETGIYELIEQKIMRLNPDIVFVQKIVSKELLKYFCEQRICIINGLTRKQINKISYLSGAKTIKNIMTIGKYQKSRLVGSLEQMKAVVKANFKQSLIYLEQAVGMFTLLISQRTPESQANLKKSLEMLMRMLRQIHLQKYLIYVDAEVLHQRPDIEAVKLIELNPDYKEMIEQLKPFNLIFYKVVLKEIRVADMDKKQQEYCRMMGKDCMLDICGEGLWCQLEPYSDRDITIGHFLLNMAANLLKKCQTCKQAHRKRFYFRDRGVEITANYLKIEQRQEQGYMREKDLTIDHMHSYLKKYKENSSIFCYFICEQCGKMMSNKGKIGKNYLKNSFHYFLKLLSSSPMNKAESNKQRRSSGMQSKECSHIKIKRCLQTFNIEFGFEVFSLHTYSIDRIDITSAAAKEVIEARLAKFIQEMMKKVLTARNSYIAAINGWLASYIAHLEQYRLSNTMESKIIDLLERIKKVNRIIEKVDEYLRDIGQRSANRQHTKGSDWTYFNREVAKIDYVLKTAIIILIYVEAKLHKKKIVKQESSNLYRLLQEEEANTEFRSTQNLLGQFLSLKELLFKKSNDQQEAPQKVTQEMISQIKAEKERPRQISDDSDYRYLRRISGSNGTLFHIQSNSVLKNFLADMKKKRFQLKKGVLLYYNNMSCKDHISILAYTLNSFDFAEQVEKSANQGYHSIKVNIVVGKTISTSWNIKKEIDELKFDEPEDLEASREVYQVIAHYHEQFQEIRREQGVDYDTYVRSITSAELWEEVSGGKSMSQFAKSNDSLLVIKTIKEAEFVEFQKFACNYIDHMKGALKTGRSSILTKIYGLYELTIKGNSFKCVVMQNLFFDLEEKDLKVYDLKGSEINRSEVPASKDKKFTGLDTNFKIDKNCQPYILEGLDHKHMYESLQEDILFLSKSEVIDYSLLVIEYGKMLRLGVIDFMRPYHFKEMLQKKYKQIKYGHEPTVLPPHQYASRFMAAVKRYFMPKVSDVTHN